MGWFLHKETNKDKPKTGWISYNSDYRGVSRGTPNNCVGEQNSNRSSEKD